MCNVVTIDHQFFTKGIRKTKIKLFNVYLSTMVQMILYGTNVDAHKKSQTFMFEKLASHITDT